MSINYLNFTGGENIYKKINKSQVLTPYFILRYNQVIPKYYLLSNPNLHSLILHYSMGSGKTSAAIFISTYYFDIFKKEKFLNYMNLNSSLKPRVIQVVGNWTTQDAFLKDIIKPEFNFVKLEQIQDIKRKLNSPYKEIRDEGEDELNKLRKGITKSFSFGDYQTVFNKCFPSLMNQKFIQNTESLMKGWKNKELTIDKEYLETLRDSIIIVDEMQRMYSTEGMNTYGFVIGALMKKAKEYNFKVIFLTGTIINNSLFEVPIIMNILREDEFKDINEYLEDELILDTQTKTIKKSKLNEIYEFFKDRFIYFNQKESNFDFTTKSINLQFTKESYKAIIVKPEDKSLPEERHIGNCIIKGENLMNIYSIEPIDYQKEKYLEINDNIKSEDTDDNTFTISIHDGVFPKGLLRYERGVYTGEALKVPELKKYSAIGNEVVKIVTNNILNGEKTVLYHDRILNFGLKQYIEILNLNGFIQYGDLPNSSTKCCKCGKTLSNHSNSHAFIPMRYSALYGDLSKNERKELTRAYNSENNLYGEVIAVMFISQVAYAGVSFLNTNNIVILNKISNLSKWKQIYSRCVRSHSHDLLPKDKKYVNIFTMALKEKNGMFKDAYYYSLRNILNGKVMNFIDEIYKHSITDTLFKNSENLPENLQENKIFKNDLYNEVELVFNRLNIKPNFPWSLEALYNRLRNNSMPLSYIDFNSISNEEILNIIVEKHLIKLFKFKDYETMYCNSLNKQNNIVYNSYNSFKFSDLQYVKIESKRIKNILKDLTQTTDQITVRNILIKLFKLSNNKIDDDIINTKSLWDAMFLIHNEYYEDDNKNFVLNHSTKGRDITKMKGFYFNNSVVLKTGEIVPLEKQDKNPEQLSKIPFGFKIVSSNSSDAGTWFLRVIILEENDDMDKRKKNRGVNCVSFKINKLVPYLSKLDGNLEKKKYCISLIETICDYAIENKEGNKILTPF